MKGAPERPESLVTSVFFLCVGGWLAISCAGALFGLIREGVLNNPFSIHRAPTLNYSTEPVGTVFFAALSVVAGVGGFCAVLLGIRDLWKRVTASD